MTIRFGMRVGSDELHRLFDDGCAAERSLAGSAAATNIAYGVPDMA
jgi:hypothetical protein